MTAEPRTRVLPKVGIYSQDIIEQDGLKWIVGKGTEDFLAVNHEMTDSGQSIHDFICSHFHPGVVFLDIGAHVGHYSVRAAAAGCKVYAVEANPESAAALRFHLHLNRLSAEIWSFAAWDTPDCLEFTERSGAPIRNGSASLASPAEYGEVMGIKVAALPLDLLLEEFTRLDVVKMDVEGSDIRVLAGMMESLIRLRPVLIFEGHLFYGTYTAAQMADCENILTVGAGYRWRDAAHLGVNVTDQFRIGIPEGTM